MAILAATQIKSMISTLNDINTFAKNYTIEHNTKIQLKVQLEEISNIAEHFEDCQAKVEEGGIKSEEECINERTFFRKLLFETKVALLELLEKYVTTKNSMNILSYSAISRNKKFNMLKLPTLKPHSFNGRKVVCLSKVLASQNNSNTDPKSTNSRVMLATAVVYITDANGTPQLCRAVIDSGAEINLISSTCAERLKLSLEASSCPITGIGMTRSNVKSIINAKLSSPINSNYNTKLQFHVIFNITNKIPNEFIDISSLKIPEQIKTQLADPNFNIPSQIDILLGAEVSYDIFDGQKYTFSDCAVLHHTTLGWVLAGKAFLPSADISIIPPLHNPSTNSSVAETNSSINAKHQI